MYSVNTVNTTTRHLKPVWPTFFYTKENILKNLTKQFWWPLDEKKHKNEISQNIVFVFQRRKYVKQVCMNEWMNEWGCQGSVTSV